MTDAPIDQNRFRLRVTAPTELIIARGLAGWSERIDVLEPLTLREELKRIGIELVERNG